MKLVKGLTKSNIGKYGIERAEALDFTDDGNRFRGFMYKGIPMTQCRGDGECYLAIRIDYLRNSFTLREWMDTEEYDLCDDFNGVSEFDIEKLIENLERVIVKVNEMNGAAATDADDEEKAKKMIAEELCEIERVVTLVKASSAWWKAPAYITAEVTKYIGYAESSADRWSVKLEGFDSLTIREKKEIIERASGTSIIGAQYYLEQIEKLSEKYSA